MAPLYFDEDHRDGTHMYDWAVHWTYWPKINS